MMWVNTFIEHYDLQVIVDARDGSHLNEIRNQISAAAQHRIKEYGVLPRVSDYEFTQLNPVLDLHTVFERKADASFSHLLTTRKFL